MKLTEILASKEFLGKQVFIYDVLVTDHIEEETLEGVGDDCIVTRTRSDRKRVYNLDNIICIDKVYSKD